MYYIHLVMKRYTVDGSPLDEAISFDEQVRYAFADHADALGMANELGNNKPGLDSEYFVMSHKIVLGSVLSKQQAQNC